MCTVLHISIENYRKLIRGIYDVYFVAEYVRITQKNIV